MCEGGRSDFVVSQKSLTLLICTTTQQSSFLLSRPFFVLPSLPSFLETYLSGPA